MLTLPDAILPLLLPFATLFSNPTWRKAQVLLVGAILTPGQRTVAAALRVMGRSDQRVSGSGQWPVGLRHRRNPGTASRRQDQRSGRLSRRGAFQPPATGQGQRSALDLPDVAGPRALGRTPLGLAGAHRAGALDAVLPAAGTPTQETHRLGAADDPATPLMVSLPNHAGCRSTPWCWWATTVTPCWICSAAASASVNR